MTTAASGVGLARWEAKTLHAFGVDEIVSLVLALRQILFFEWVTLNEHKWSILVSAEAQ